jgi:hypothetical protein
MSYQPYPSGGSYQQYPSGGNQVAQRPPQPPSIRNAVMFMYAGAAISALSVVLLLAFSGRIKNAIHKALVKANNKLITQGKTPLTAAQIHSTENTLVIVIAVILLIGVALWVWMAWANGKGRGWARIVATVLFALNTIYLLLSVSRATVSIIFIGLGWLCGLGAIIFLWNKNSTAYIKSGTF